jgi:hypothetical protein
VILLQKFTSTYVIKGYNVRFEVFTAVTMKNAVFWDVALCRSLVNQSFYPEDAGDTFLRNISSHKIYTVPHPRIWHSSKATII